MTRGMAVFLAGAAASLGFGWYAFPRMLYRSEAQPIRFSHKVHTGAAGLKCEDCHWLNADGSFSGIPGIAKCAGCHAAQMGTSPDEKVLVERYVTPNREIPWKSYARQPDNAWFPHSAHVKLAKIPCARCHGDQGETDRLRPYQEDRINGYSRDIWGMSMSRIVNRGQPGMKMDDCESCHNERRVETGCLDCHK
jgi:menaquinone reductase, multiheme cytochrome c subunit